MRPPRWYVPVFVIALMISILSCCARAESYRLGESVPLVLEIFDLVTGTTISGESPTVGLWRETDGYWWDWDDSSFKASGWVEQFKTLTEITTTGRYGETWDSTGENLGSYVAILSNTGANQTEATISFLLISGQPSLGTGQVPVNENYPSALDQQPVDEYGAPLADVTIRVYSRTDYDAGRVQSQYIQGITTSDVNGYWRDYVYLDPGDYTTTFSKRGRQTSTYEFTVTAP